MKFDGSAIYTRSSTCYDLKIARSNKIQLTPLSLSDNKLYVQLLSRML